MKRFVKKLTITVATVTTAFALTGGSALAFECFNASRSAQGNAAAAGSPALISAEEALMMFCGLSAADAAEAIAAMEDLGFDMGFLINGHALMAGGLEKNGKGGEKLQDGKGIDHLSGEFFAALGEVAPACTG